MEIEIQKEITHNGYIKNTLKKERRKIYAGNKRGKKYQSDVSTFMTGQVENR